MRAGSGYSERGRLWVLRVDLDSMAEMRDWKMELDVFILAAPCG